MGLFDKKREPIILKESTSSKEQVSALNKLLITASDEMKPKLEMDLKILNYGISGENQILFELKNSHIPMYVLHDLYLEDNGLSAQIDFFIVTEKKNYIVECKNLYGDIEINSNDEFYHIINYDGNPKKEGFYSPITQNRKHIELIKQIRGNTKNNFLTKSLFEQNFNNLYKGIIVFTNPKTVINVKYAKKEIKEQIIRVDQLVEYIRNENTSSTYKPSSDKGMVKIANFFLAANKENHTDYLAKYK